MESAFNGRGGNGKGLLDELLRFCLGDYFYEADITLLTTKKKGGDGPNQELADIFLVRWFGHSDSDVTWEPYSALCNSIPLHLYLKDKNLEQLIPPRYR